MNKLPRLFLLVCVFLSACSAPIKAELAAPIVTPTPQKRVCTVIAEAGDGWILLRNLGLSENDNPEIMINGVITNPEEYRNLQTGDVMSLVGAGPSTCQSGYNLAAQVGFDDAILSEYGGDWRLLGGFKKPITLERILNVTAQTCGAVRADNSVGFNGSIETGGCSIPTLVKFSVMDGSTECGMHGSAVEAYNALKDRDLTTIKSLAIAILWMDQTDLEDAERALCQ